MEERGHSPEVLDLVLLQHLDLKTGSVLLAEWEMMVVAL